MSSPSLKYSIGIDPGWKNLGVSCVAYEGSRIVGYSSKTTNPSLIPRAKLTGEIFRLSGIPEGECPSTVVIERYVSYQNVHTAETENILMLIGALQERAQFTYEDNSSTLLYRAIDWKPNLVKALYRTKGFSNPSSRLDKEFSIAAALACTDPLPRTFETDHEADSICLACTPIILAAQAPR